MNLKTKPHPEQLREHTYLHGHTTKNNAILNIHTQKKHKGDHSLLGSTNIKFLVKNDHPHKLSPRYPQLFTKRKMKK